MPAINVGKAVKPMRHNTPHLMREPWVKWASRKKAWFPAGGKKQGGRCPVRGLSLWSLTGDAAAHTTCLGSSSPAAGIQVETWQWPRHGPREAHFHHTLYFFQREGQWRKRRQGGKGGQDWQSVVLPQQLEIDIKNWQVKNDP